MRHRRLAHRFVEHIPEILEPGLIYISLEYATSAHSCCCGCGEEVVTPITPTDWKITFDGETISMWPSVGNWTLACRSHYVIDRGEVVRAEPWTDEEVDAERRRAGGARARYYSGDRADDAPSPTAAQAAPSRTQGGWWRRAWRGLSTK
jgi:hypothetical protein